MYIPSPKYGSPNLGKNVSIVGEANFGSEPYLITIGEILPFRLIVRL
jgi:hypothetical protein